jgi:hypothetical protein
MATVMKSRAIRVAAAIGSLIGLLGAGFVAPEAQAALPVIRNTADIFTNTAAFCYRVPAVVRDKSGNTYAFAERRRRSCSNDGDFEIVMRKRTNAGVWSGITVVADDLKNRLSHPAPIYNPDNNTIVLLYSKATYTKNVYKVSARKTVGIYQKVSADGGATWSAPSLAYKTWTLVGAGHGVYAGGGVMSVATGFNNLIRNAAGVWTPGFTVPSGLVDGTLTHLSSGYFTCYRVRDAAIKRSHRCAKVSADGKTVASFSSSGFHVPETVSEQASLLTFTKGGKSWVLMSTPSNKTVHAGMSIYAAPESTLQFGASKVGATAASVSAGYSDLVQVDGNYAGIVFETGDKIQFSEVKVASILK